MTQAACTNVASVPASAALRGRTAWTVSGTGIPNWASVGSGTVGQTSGSLSYAWSYVSWNASDCLVLAIQFGKVNYLCQDLHATCAITTSCCGSSQRPSGADLARIQLSFGAHLALIQLSFGTHLARASIRVAGAILSSLEVGSH